MSLLRSSAAKALRIVTAGVCVFGIWYSLRLALADLQFHRDTEESIRAAIRLASDGWPYYMRLALYDRDHAERLLETSLALNPFDAQADVELGLQYEADGNIAAAERQMNQAFAIDNTYMPRWSLANFYFRQGNEKEFWKWARMAADMPADDVGALLELCWRASSDPATVSAELVNQNPGFLRQYANFLLAKGQPAAAADVVQQLFSLGDPKSDLPYMIEIVNRLVSANQPSAAFLLWHRLIQNRWIVADWTMPNNASFERTPLPISLDWSLHEYQGLHSWTGPSGLETEFAGNEPEDCVIAEQSVILGPGNYALAFSYQTSSISPSTGIRWQLLNPSTQKVVAETEDLSSEKPKKAELRFFVSKGAPLLQLQLRYRRRLGTVRVSGTLNMREVQIQSQPS
jgi:hypothetical protein